MISPAFTFISKNEEDTQAFGRKLAKMTKKNDIFALFGTLGMGKSVLSRAFIQSLTPTLEEVPSPTFTLAQSYETPNFMIYHFDLYRIKKAEEIFEIGIEEAMYDGVSLIEWPEKMGPYLPRDSFKIDILPEGSYRKITIYSPIPGKQERIKEMFI